MRVATFVPGVLLCAAALVAARSDASEPARATSPRPQWVAVRRFELPATFETNRGQAPEGWDFLVRCRGYHAFVRAGETVFSFDDHALRMSLDGARAVAPDVAALGTPARVSYFEGNDRSKWITGIPLVAGAVYRGVAPGTTWRTAANGRHLEFRLTVPADAEPRLSLDGAESLRVADDGSLRVAMPSGEATFTAPLAWQDAAGAAPRRDVAARFVCDGDGVRIALGARDPARPVEIDPTVTYATYLGGAGTDVRPRVAFDASGNLHVAAATHSGNFPRSGPGFNTSTTGISSSYAQIVVARLSGTTGAMLHGSFVGSPTRTDDVGGLAVLPDGSAVVGITTGSNDFPTTSGSFAPTSTLSNTQQAALLKVSPDGTQLVWSTFVTGLPGVADVAAGPYGDVHILGGTFLDRITADGTARTYHLTLPGSTGGGTTQHLAMCADPSDHLYLAGNTTDTTLAITAGTYQTAIAGFRDGVLTRYGPDGSVVWRTLIGGASADEIWGVGTDAAGHPWVAGSTTSIGFPFTQNAYRATPSVTINAASDAFLARFTPDGKKLRYSTFLGGNGLDDVRSLEVHPTGATVLCGATSSTDLDSSAGFQTSNRGGYETFVATFAPDGAHEWTSYLGGTGQDYPGWCATGPDGRIAVAVSTGSTNVTTVNAVQPAFGGTTYDVFLVQTAGTRAVSATPVLIGTAPVTGATVGAPCSIALPCSGGTPPYRWSLGAGTLPAGFSLAEDGTLSGSSGQASVTPVLLRVEDANGHFDDRDLDFVVNALPSPLPATLAAWTVGRPMTQTISVSGGSGPFSYEIVAGAAPPGTSFGADGRLTGTPSSAGYWPLTVKVTDVHGVTGTRAYGLTVNAVPTVTPSTFPEWTTGQAFRFPFGCAAGTGPFTFALDGGSAPAPSLDATTGLFQGAASAAGTYDYTVRAIDIRGAETTRAYRTVLNPLPSVTTAAVPPAAAGRAYAAQLRTSGGTAPFDWGVLTSSLPAGLQLAAATGIVSGTPTARADVSAIVGATDLALALAQRPIRFRVAEVADLTKRKSLQTLTISPTADRTMLRAIEVTAGCVLDVVVTGGGAKFQKPVVQLLDALGDPVDLGRTLVPGYKGAKIRRFVVPATGRYFVSCEPAEFFVGKLKMKISIAPPAKWSKTAPADEAADDLVVPFAAPPGAKVTVALKPGRGSAAVPVLAALTGPDGADLLAGGTLKTKGSTVTFASALLAEGGDHELRISTQPGKPGNVAYTVTLRLPKTYGFSMAGVAAGGE